jgi:hypothetical protein
VAVMIGKTKGWLWWLAGTFCAMIFGAQAMAAQAVAVYGIRPNPAPKVDPSKVTEELKTQAKKLIADWMGGVKATEPSAEELTQVVKLIESLGSNDFKLREAASTELAKFGSKALKQLLSAQENKDPEVRIRAQRAINIINNSSDRKEIVALRKIRDSAIFVIQARQRELSKQSSAMYREYRDLRKAGKGEEAAAKLKETRKFSLERSKLSRLLRLIVGIASSSGPNMQVRYGVRVMPAPMRAPVQAPPPVNNSAN